MAEAQGKHFYEMCSRECGTRMRRPVKLRGTVAICRSCRSSTKTRWDYWLKMFYNITPQRWQEMWDEQGGLCGICSKDLSGTKNRPHIDHDHRCCPLPGRSCGRCIRGLLCPRCNAHLENFARHEDCVVAWVRRSVRKVVCFDLDSTLADTTHRQWLVPKVKAGQATWQEYAMLCTGDGVLPAAVLARALYPEHKLHIVTNRHPASRALTEGWLKLHVIPYDVLEMCSSKVAYIQQLQAQGYDVRLFVEDWAEVAQEVTEQTGVPCLVVKTEYLADVVTGI